MTNCISKEAIDEKEKHGCAVVSSMNAENCVTNDTKLIIVGTITPPNGQNNGYFYTAPRNKLYGYLDEALGTKLKSKKIALYGASNKDKQKIIEEIKQELIAHKVAFLDVIKKAIRKNGKEDSCYDNDIECYCLDCESFQNIPVKTYFICNSLMAHECFEKLCPEIYQKENTSESRSTYLPQRGKGSSKEKWLDKIRNILK